MAARHEKLGGLDRSVRLTVAVTKPKDVGGFGEDFLFVIVSLTVPQSCGAVRARLACSRTRYVPSITLAQRRRCTFRRVRYVDRVEETLAFGERLRHAGRLPQSVRGLHGCEEFSRIGSLFARAV